MSVMAEDPWNRSFRLVGPSDLPPEDWDMIGAFYVPNERAPSPPAQSMPARNPDPWAAFPNWPPTQMIESVKDPDALSRFYASQAGAPDWSVTDLAPTDTLRTTPRSFSDEPSFSQYTSSPGPFTQVPKPNNIQLSGSRGDNMSHCLPSYVLCQEYHGSGPLISGKHCDDCHNMCLLNGYWPHQYCPL